MEPFVIWLTGRPASGKTTVAAKLVRRLRHLQAPVLWLDSDELRRVMTPQPTYGDEERDRFYDVVGFLARKANVGGVSVVISATASKRIYREALRASVAHFVEAWVSCTGEELRRRDVKGLYARAERREVQNLPGVDAPYESPRHAEVVLESSSGTPAELVRQLIGHLSERGLWPRDAIEP